MAADAVVQEDKSGTDGGQDLPESSNTAISKQPQDKIDNFYFFSPPTETEGEVDLINQSKVNQQIKRKQTT